MSKEINLNELNKMAGGNCRSIGEMFSKIKTSGTKKVSKTGIAYRELSKEQSQKIFNILDGE